MIAITFALPAEGGDLVRAVGARKYQNGFIYGKLATRDIAICYTGVGEKACRIKIHRFLEAVRPAVLISAGFAGALTESLKPGDLIAAENYSDGALINSLAAGSPATIHRVRLLTTSSIVDSANDRIRMAAETGASAVDMESAVIAKACAERSIRMLSLRAISDTRERPFPLPPSILFDVDRQKTNAFRLGRYLTAHPAAIVRLVQFWRRIAKARKTLADTIVSSVHGLGREHYKPISGGP